MADTPPGGVAQAPAPAGIRGAPSGAQFTIEAGRCRAVVTEVGASLRELTVGGAAVLWSYAAEAMAGGGRGQLLAPWPNRLEDGSYEFAGVSARAALDEPDRHNAIHGLVRWLLWSLKDRTGSRVRLSCELAPQPGYPWRLALEVSYEVDGGGVLVSAAAENRSGTAAPFGMGFHPYLDAGPGGLDGCRLRLAAGRRLLLDERGLPVGSVPVTGTQADYTAGRPLAGARLDDCFADLAGAAMALPEGAAWQATLERADGSKVALWADAAWPYVMCYTGDTLPEGDRRRGLAVEPMTCPPNALRSGESLVVLDPGERWSGRFGIRQLD